VELSKIRWNCVKHQPEPIRKASAEVAHDALCLSSPTRRLTDRLHQTFDTVLEDAPVLLLSMVAPDHLLLLLWVTPLV
jgi:hypothetical protein